MKIETLNTEYTLTALSIDQIAERVEEFLYSIETERANVFRIRLAVEEALLRWQEKFGEEKTILLTTGSRLYRPYISLELRGESYDPLVSDEAGLGSWSENLLTGIGLAPRYSYQRGVNILNIRLRRRQRNPALILLACLAVSLFVGLVGDVALPENVQTLLIRTTLDPIQSVFFRILNAASGPVIFCMVLVAICGLGSVATGGKAGRKMLLRSILISTILTVVALLIAIKAFSLHYYDSPMTGTRFTSVLDFFLQFIPNDILSPFISGDTRQIILVAVIFGNAILVAGTQSDALLVLVEQLNATALIVAGWVGKVSPFFISILLILGLWHGAYQPLLRCWQPFLLFLVLSVLALAGWMLWVSRTRKVPFRKLARKIKPSFLLALRTASVDVAYGDNALCCEKRLGISPKVTSYGLPLGLVIYMPSATMATMVFTAYAAKTYGIVISTVWCITAVTLTVTLLAATPPMAGIGLLAYAAIFSRLGIPSDGLTIALLADILFGFVTAAVNQAMLQMELVIHADRIGELNLNILRK